MAFHAKFRAN